jgi:hypothetical protein
MLDAPFQGGFSQSVVQILDFWVAAQTQIFDPGAKTGNMHRFFSMPC